MTKKIQSRLAVAVVLSLGGVGCFAQSSGEAIYKAKCMGCHGAAGMAETSVGKTLKVKPVTDPAVKRLSETQMLDATRNGMGKMQAFKDKLTDAQIKAAVGYFRTFLK